MQVVKLKAIDFPLSLQPLCELIGVEGVLQIVLVWEDEKLYIPQKILTEHPLSCVGMEACNRLSYWYGGCLLKMPKLQTIVRRIRNRSIRCSRRSGVSVRLLSDYYNLTERQIWTILGTEVMGVEKRYEVVSSCS